MFNRIRKKLNSRRGASITFGLFIFVVCAVLGAVALTAGTASAGRAAKMAEMDQRYHAVNSAAELIAKELCGEANSVTIVRERVVETTTVKTRTFNEDGTYTEDEPTISYQYTYSTKVGHGNLLSVILSSQPSPQPETTGLTLPSGSDMSLTRYMAVHQLFGTNKANCEGAMDYSMENGFVENERTFKLSTTINSALDVKVTVERVAHGNLKVTIKNLVEDSQTSASDIYTLEMILEASIVEPQSEPIKTKDGPTVTSDTNKTTETTVETETLTKTSAISWSVKSVKKG